MTLDLTILVACLAVTALSYLVGRHQRDLAGTSNPQVKRAVERANSIVNELVEVGTNVRQNLDTHRRHLHSFNARLREMTRSIDGPQWEQLSVEAENLLKPTLALSSQIAHAYDTIRQQTHLLMSLTEVRTDPLTGLRNRRALDEAIQSRLAMLERYGTPFAIAVFDIDHFKRVNDEQGHMEGDRILQDVAAMLDIDARDTDVVTRFGGEEFVVVMPETTLEGACIFAERARERIAAELTVTVSGGVTPAVVGDDPRRLISRGDRAMYAAKSAGRNRVVQLLEDGSPEIIEQAHSASQESPALEARPTPEQDHAETQTSSRTSSSAMPPAYILPANDNPMHLSTLETTTEPTLEN